MNKPYYTSQELANLFGMRNTKVLSNSIHNGTFPVPTYRLGKLRVADREVVELYFNLQRDKGLKELMTS